MNTYANLRVEFWMPSKARAHRLVKRLWKRHAISAVVLRESPYPNSKRPGATARVWLSYRSDIRDGKWVEISREETLRTVLAELEALS